MAVAAQDGVEIAYELVGEGQTWVLTPGGRVQRAIANTVVGQMLPPRVVNRGRAAPR